MSETNDLLRGELERLFELEEMTTLASELMGYSPNELGGTAGKGAFARALVERCENDSALQALADAMNLFGKSANVAPVFVARAGRQLEPGEEVGGFKILKPLADGGLGKLYLAERVDGDEKVRVAIKVIRSSLSRDLSAVARFLTVQRAFRRSPVEGIARVYDCGHLADGRAWVATEYVEGQTLAARIERVGPMHFNEARPVFQGVLKGLQRIHEKGLVHSDVKSGNVFVTRPKLKDGERGEPTGVLVDGGAWRLLAGGANRQDAMGALRVFGNAHAIAPEMARGHTVAASADVYAVGIMLYEVLTGRLPFQGSSAFEVIAKHLDHPPTPPSEVAPKGWVTKEIDELVLQALAKDPQERFGSARELFDAIEKLAKPKKEKRPLDESAFDSAANALRNNPDDADKASAFETVFGPAHEWERGIEVLREAMDKTDDAEAKKGLLYRIVRIQEAELDDRDAAEASFLAILELDAADDVARSGLEELRRNRGDHEGLAEVLLEKAETMEDATERAEVLREIAAIYEDHLEDPDNALVAWTQALADDPSDDKSVRAVERIAGESTDRWNEVLGSLSEVAQAGQDADTVRLYCLMGRWYGDALKRPDFALPCYGKAIELDPQCDDAYEGTLKLFRRAKSWPESVQLLESRAKASSNPAQARDHQAAAALIVLDKLGDKERAIEMFSGVLKEDPTHPAALDALEGLHEERKEWKKLGELLQKRVGMTGGKEKLAATLKLAELYEDRLDDLEGSIVQFEAAFAQDATCLDALKGLERVYARKGNYEKLRDTLERQIPLLATPRQKIAALEHIGAIQEEEFVDHDGAIAAYEQVVEIDPGNEEANPALARLYRQKGRFDDLVETLERHARASEDQQRKTDLMHQAAKVLMVDVGAPERALELCERVLSIAPNHEASLSLVARLKAQTGDASAAVSAVDRLVDGEKDPVKKAEHLVEAGRLLEESGDNDGAIDRFKRALDADEKNVTAANALRRLYGARGDAHGAAELLRREIAATSGKSKQAELYAELGTLCRERLEDPDKARDAFIKALELDGTCTPAGRALGDMAFEAKQYEDAAKYLEPLLARTDKMDASDARDISVRCGDAFRELGEFAKAQRAYLNAKAYASSDREVLERVADVTFEAGEADEAAVLYGELIAKVGTQLEPMDRGRVLYRQGEALRRSKELDKAIVVLDKAAALLQEDPKPLEALRAIYEEKGEWDNVVRTLRRRMEHAADTERFDLLVQVGDVLKDKLSDREKSAKSYVSALEIVPDDRNLLTKLMGVYGETKDWSRLVEVILRIAELVDDPAQLAKYYVTAASIAHNELGRHDEAADYYEQALENDPSMKRAFKGLATCLEAANNWSGLANAYRAHLQRNASAPASERAELWDKLGDIYKDQLSDLTQATEAYEQAQELDPDSRRRLEMLTEIYEQNPKRFYRKAVEAHMAMLRKSPYRIESYQALRQLYTDVKRPDESWCVCQTLRVLNMAGPDEEKFFKKHRSRHPAAAEEFFSEDIWFNHLVHPTQDPLLTGIFATITPAVVATRSQELSAYQIDASAKRNPESDDSVMVQTLHYVSGVTQVALPDVYYRKADPGGLSLMLTAPPSIGVGKAALAGGPAQALAFLAARHLSYFRPGHNLRHLLPSGSGLRVWLLAAIKLATPQFPVPGSLSKKVDKALAALQKHVDAKGRTKLDGLVQKLLAAAPELDMKKWVAAVDLTADRVGFVMANDLELTAAVIKASPDEESVQKERLKELYLYSVSEAYLQLRHKIGLAIEG